MATAAGLQRVSPDATLYLLPEGICDPAPDSVQATLPLAGTGLHFSMLRLIAARYGARQWQALVPVGEAQAAFSYLSDDQQARAALLLERLTAPRPALALPGGVKLDFSRPRIMGILNVTPDSFSDGGRYHAAAAAIAHGQAMAKAGAALIDIGGESTRPGARPVWEGDEIARVVPVIEGLAKAGHILSIDSRKAAVMKAALAAGAVIVNDITALTYDKEAVAVVAASGAPAVLMHSPADPAVMQENPRYDDVLLDVFDALEARVETCARAGIDRARLIVDPGIGFGKTVRHNLALINGLALFHGLGAPLMLGASRKSFIGAIARAEAPDARLPGSLAAAMLGVARGAQLFRVHDVAQTAQALAVWQASRDVALMPPTS